LFKVGESSRCFFFVYLGDCKTNVDQDEVAGLDLRSEREVDVLSNPAKVHVSGAEGGIHLLDSQNLSGHG
jgi:hypothetical protein